VYELLADAAIRTHQGSFGNIVAVSLGPLAATWLRVMIVLNTLGVVVAYAQTVVDVSGAVGISSKGDLSLAVASGDPTRLHFLVWLFSGFSIALFLEFYCGHVADWGSLIANTSLLSLVALCVGLGQVSSPLVQESIQCQVVTKSDTWSAAGLRFGHSLVFAFSSAEYVLYACNVADEDGNIFAGVSDAKLRRRVRSVGGCSLLLSTLLYIMIGQSAVGAFGVCTKEDVLSNLSPAQAPAGWSIGFAVVLAVNALSLILSFPVFVQALLLNLRELGAPVDPNKPWRGAVWVVPVAGVIVSQVPGLQWVIDVVCSWTDVFFMFVLPPLMFILSPRAGAARFLAKFLAWGLLLGALALNAAKWYDMF